MNRRNIEPIIEQIKFRLDRQTDGQTDRQTDKSIPVYPPQTSWGGGILDSAGPSVCPDVDGILSAQ